MSLFEEEGQSEWYDAFEEEGQSEWYDVTVPYDVASSAALFAVTFTEVIGKPMIAFRIPEGCTAGSIFRVHLPRDAVESIVEANEKHCAPMACTLGLTMTLPENDDEVDEENRPVLRFRGTTNLCLDTPTKGMPSSIPLAQPDDESPSQLTQSTVNLTFMRQRMERFRENREKGIIESPERDFEHFLVEEETAPPLNLYLEDKTESDKEDDELLERIRHCAPSTDVDEFLREVDQYIAAPRKLGQLSHTSPPPYPPIPPPIAQSPKTPSPPPPIAQPPKTPSPPPQRKRPAIVRQDGAGTKRGKISPTRKSPQTSAATARAASSRRSPRTAASSSAAEPSRRSPRTSTTVASSAATAQLPSTAAAAAAASRSDADDAESGKDGEEDRCCLTCGKTPCEWLDYGVLTLGALTAKFNCSTAIEHGYVVELATQKQVPNNKVRFAMYRMCTYEKYGFLGKGNRIKFPSCVEGKVKEIFPDLDGNYTNFSPTGDNDSDGSNF